MFLGRILLNISIDGQQVYYQLQRTSNLKLQTVRRGMGQHVGRIGSKHTVLTYCCFVGHFDSAFPDRLYTFDQSLDIHIYRDTGNTEIWIEVEQSQFFLLPNHVVLKINEKAISEEAMQLNIEAALYRSLETGAGAATH